MKLYHPSEIIYWHPYGDEWWPDRNPNDWCTTHNRQYGDCPSAIETCVQLEYQDVMDQGVYDIKTWLRVTPAHHYLRNSGIHQVTFTPKIPPHYKKPPNTGPYYTRSQYKSLALKMFYQLRKTVRARQDILNTIKIVPSLGVRYLKSLWEIKLESYQKLHRPKFKWVLLDIMDRPGTGIEWHKWVEDINKINYT
jgi:hypothetical protein